MYTFRIPPPTILLALQCYTNATHHHHPRLQRHREAFVVAPRATPYKYDRAASGHHAEAKRALRVLSSPRRIAAETRAFHHDAGRYRRDLR